MILKTAIFLCKTISTYWHTTNPGIQIQCRLFDYNNLSNQTRKTLYKLHLTINIRFTIHQSLKNAVCKRPSMLIIAILLSLFCPIVLYKYLSTFKARSQMSVNKHNLKSPLHFIY